ncbi:hypothetical protein P409_00145 [Inquilinus limosus MP06]|uniref:Helicase C-terminal domain-containing protein n=2 Tax=Inquilinus limosus TaxID=171674 RepID=A0A0A0DBJ7_9PROT|nr:hypothetical protein P409_00145 [Inquilinus limosus MP06]
MWPQPKSLLEKNYWELLKFSEFEPDDIVIFDGNPKQRAELMAKPYKVWLMGFTRFADDWANLMAAHPGFDCVAVDEFHMGFGGWKSKRTQQLVTACRRMKHFLPMTGTLVDGRLDSVYPAVHIIEPLYYASYEAFLYQHEVKDWNGKRIGWTGHEKISAILGRHCIRRTFEMVYGKQEVVTHVERVAMSPKQRELYKEMEKNALIELEDAFLEAGFPGTHVIRLRQLMEHPEAMPHPVTGDPVDLMNGEVNGKDERLLIHLTDHWNSGKPLIIFGSLVKSLERMAKLAESVGLRTGLIHGGVSAAKRAVIDEQFRNGELDVVVCSPATAAVGFNWGHVDHIIFASIDYKDTNYVQARGRAIRGKREKPLRVTVLEYEKSIDQRIFQIVEQKSKDAKLVDPTREQLQLAS